ncbi:IS3 family transposase [Legionella quinlivanii]|uniref:IS3 family transposase n=1 Tax=Legionella quinlivanii TaxID=45073 RepID=UPI002243FB2C|nr:IS3 family transposase [Legionella quinlivanii]MCW8451819.1 IS3 family transposase [Legionella quinlivanii]
MEREILKKAAADSIDQAKLKALFMGSKNTYGSRRLAKELTAQGFPVGRYKARRMMEKLR